MTVWELRDGVYVGAGSATAAETLIVEQPFPLGVVPADLVR
ncbi:hypothetical protein [Nocardioides dilutus]